MEKRVRHSFQIGDILVSSWGYDQTNISFYQVVALNGASMVTVKPCQLQEAEADCVSGMSQRVSFQLPSPGTIVADENAKPIRRKVLNYGTDSCPDGDLIAITGYERARRYSGGKLYQSWYA